MCDIIMHKNITVSVCSRLLSVSMHWCLHAVPLLVILQLHKELHKHRQQTSVISRRNRQTMVRKLSIGRQVEEEISSTFFCNSGSIYTIFLDSVFPPLSLPSHSWSSSNSSKDDAREMFFLHGIISALGNPASTHIWVLFYICWPIFRTPQNLYGFMTPK